MSECVALLNQALETTSPRGIASYLGLNPNTVSRWIDQARVPTSYRRDLLRLLGRRSICGGNERDKDQFYTKPEVAGDCLSRFHKVAQELDVRLDDYVFVEPSAGAGVFYQQFPQSRRIGMDIDPRMRPLLRRDYLTWAPEHKSKYVVVGNPPFGLRGHLALQFINHSANFADLVGFILPPLFDSDGKGVPAKRVRGYWLAHTSRIERNSFEYPDGTAVDVEAIFQVWTRVNWHKIQLPKKPTCDSLIKVYSLSDGGTPASTRNKHMLYKCDIYLPSTCFNGMRVYNHFEELPHRRGYGVVVHKRRREVMRTLLKANWERVAFRSTNGALNLRTSLIQSVLTEANIHD